jgi:hypothetical protein
LFGQLGGFVERIQTLGPGRLLGVVDLAQLENGALGGVSGAQPAVLDDTPGTMQLAVLFAGVEAQEHVLAASASRPGRTGEAPGSPLAGQVHSWCAAESFRLKPDL